MTLTSKDHYDLIAMFEREFDGIGRFDKEDKSMWTKGHVYQSGEVNKIFIAYRKGAAYGRATA